ncbi:MAG: AAA family ATPase [Novosphingobium sp.]|uniref:AAA family ATPase n=1 Tax=Novosphingobium sp. TaxID=1874826 RepID=UPI003B998572
MLTVCFHGAESTGKSVMGERLHERFGWPCVPEYGRTYCEEHGTDLSMDDLLAIAAGHAAATEAAAQARPEVLLLDTDPLMTAAWAQMLFGEVPDRLLAYPKADFYLLFQPDVPWVADGTRFFGESAERARFAALSEAILTRAGVRWERVGGSWTEREARIVSAVKDAISSER